jgi:hypothetical protein
VSLIGCGVAQRMRRSSDGSAQTWPGFESSPGISLPTAKKKWRGPRQNVRIYESINVPIVWKEKLNINAQRLEQGDQTF